MADVEVSALVGAPPDRVWTVVGDPARVGEISPECRRIRYRAGATGPAPGVRFTGHNRKGALVWRTVSTITSYEPGRVIGWEVTMAGLPSSRWEFRLDGEGDGTRVTQTWQDRRGRLIRLVGASRARDAAAHNRSGMERTLDAVRRLAESG
jgi:carbon monoxide dehydrogenase subunit G